MPARVLAALLALVACAVLAASPVVAQEPDAALREQLDEVVAQREETDAQLAQATARLDDLTARQGRAREQSEQLGREITQLQETLRTSRTAIDRYAQELYRGQSSGGDWLQAFGAAPQDLGDRSHYLSAVARDEQAAVERSSAAEADLTARRQQAAAVEDELARLQEEATAGAVELEERLAEAGGAERALRDELRRREEEARRLAAEAEARRQEAERAAAEERERAEAAAAEAEEEASDAQEAADDVRDVAVGPPSANGMVCPQDNPRRFTDTWGAPRGGGTRSHQGTDVFGDRGGDVFAIADGVVRRLSNGSTSGLYLTLRGDDGDDYYYMHLQDFVASEGQRVAAGELIAHNGDTGNARGTTPHIHFELHPGGGGAVNPYPLLRATCG